MLIMCLPFLLLLYCYRFRQASKVDETASGLLLFILAQTHSRSNIHLYLRVTLKAKQFERSQNGHASVFTDLQSIDETLATIPFVSFQVVEAPEVAVVPPVVVV